MKKFVLCMSVFCSLEAQASTVADTWEQWNPLSRLWAQEQVQPVLMVQDEEAPAVSGEVSAEVPDAEYGLLFYQKDNKQGVLEWGIKLLIPTNAVECAKQWFEKLRQGDLATIVLTALGSAGIIRFIGILWG